MKSLFSVHTLFRGFYKFEILTKLPLAASFVDIDSRAFTFPFENHFNVGENICNGQFEL